MNPVDPTLSILLPTHRDRWRLAIQLEAIVPQLRPVDQLVLLLDGSDDVTRHVAETMAPRGTVLLHNERASGVCKAYNQCERHATGTWLIGASGNDEWQPGALAAWLDASQRFPQAQVMFGHITTWDMKPWLESTGWIDRRQLPAIWKDQGWQTHGAAAFIRKDAWGRGYPETLGYMADHFQTMMLAFAEGCVYLRHKISRVNFLDTGISQEHGDEVKRHKEMAEFLRLVHLPEYDHVRPVFKLFDIMTGWSQGKGR